MTFYAAAFRHVPVNWIVGSMNIVTSVLGVFGWTVERIWSFFTALWYNICGFDKYFIFMDNSPVPIPYLHFGGNPGSNCWLYDARNKIFYGCDDENKNKKEFLPVLSMEVIWQRRGEFVSSDMSSWLEQLQIYTYDERFPHPLQILSAWSLDSYLWPATMRSSKTLLETISAQTGDTEYIHLYQNVCKHAWYDFNDDEEEEAEAEETEDLHVSETTEDSNASETTEEGSESISVEGSESISVEGSESSSQEVSAEGSSHEDIVETESESDKSAFDVTEKPLPPSPQSD